MYYKSRVLCLNVQWNRRLVRLSPQYQAIPKKITLVCCHQHCYSCCALVTIQTATNSWYSALYYSDTYMIALCITELSSVVQHDIKPYVHVPFLSSPSSFPPPFPLHRCAFLHFCSEKRPKLKQENPNLSVGAMARQLSLAWKLMTSEQKKPYDEMADRDKQRYGHMQHFFYTMCLWIANPG